jgi:superoxide dismutase
MFARNITGLVFRTFVTSEPIPKVALPELKYDYSALEPVLSNKLLELHHKKHHKKYVDELNSAIQKFESNLYVNLEARANFDYN